MNNKIRLSLCLMFLAMLSLLSCERRQDAEPIVKGQTEQEQSIVVDLRLVAGEPELPQAEGEVRAIQNKGALRLRYLNGVPYIQMLDTRLNTQTGVEDSVRITAECVFRPLKAGSTTELDPTRALYGSVVFKRRNQSEPTMGDDGKATPVELISDGQVTLRGNTTFKEGEQWYMMGVVGGTHTTDSRGQHRVEVNGFLIGVEDNGTYTGFDAQNEGNGSMPFVSSWIKLDPIKKGYATKITTTETIRFRFQGTIFAIDVRNDTNYKLSPNLIQIQSTEMTRKVSYNLSAALNVAANPEQMPWDNNAQKDVTNVWFINPMSLRTANGSALYKLDPKNSATNGNYLYDITEPKKYKVTVLCWLNSVETSLAKRTGFFISVTNDEAKPAWNETYSNGNLILSPNTTQSQTYKYVLTSDSNLDGILGTGDNHARLNGRYNPNIKMAPSMDFICAKTYQRSLKNNRGKYVHLTISVPVRPVMPIETLSQNNVYDHQNGAKLMEFVPFPAGSRYDYAQYADYAKQFAARTEANRSSYWILPNLNQWYGFLMAGHNGDNAHNWNDDGGGGIYDWVEGLDGDYGQEEIQFSDGHQQTYYAMYGRPSKDSHNRDRIYALRFFSDKEKNKGTDQFALTRYYARQYNGKDVLAIETVWLGKEYAKLYEGLYPNKQSWIREIAANDTEGESSMFVNLRRDFVTRYLLVEVPSGNSIYNSAMPLNYDRNMVGYFYGPSSSFINSNHAKAIVFKNKVLFTGPSSSTMNFDFTNYRATRSAVGYLRAIRRDFTAFEY